MKKIFIIFLSLVLISFAFASCVEETGESSVELSAEENHLTSSEESRTADENSEESSEESIENTKPENIMYNPNDFMWLDWDALVTTLPGEHLHLGLNELCQNEDFDDDVYFCVEFVTYEDPEIDNLDKHITDLTEYLISKGAIIDEEITQNFFDNDGHINKNRFAVAYINEKIFNEFLEDNYAIKYAWLCEGCLDGVHGNGTKLGYCN